MTSPGPGPTLRLTARTSEDLVALGTVVLGFTPDHSVVLLTFGATRPFHARIDLPPGTRDRTGDPAGDLTGDLAGDLTGDLRDLTDSLLDPATIHGAHDVVVLIYCEDARLADRTWQFLREGLAVRGLGLKEALRVTPRRWYPLRSGSAPRGLRERAAGTAYDISAHPFLVHAVVEGRVTLGSRAELAATLTTDPVAAARLDATVRSGGWSVPIGDTAILAEGEWARAMVLRHLHAGTEPGDEDAARLLCSLGSLRVRDAVLDLIRRDESASASVRRQVDLWRGLVRRSPDPLLPPVAAVLAWAAWQSGDGALAWCGIDRCTQVDPDYRLAELLSVLLESAAAPSEWGLDGTLDWRAGLRAG